MRLQLRLGVGGPAACALRQIQTRGQRQLPTGAPTLALGGPDSASVATQALRVLHALQAADVLVVPVHASSSPVRRRCGFGCVRDRRWTRRPPSGLLSVVGRSGCASAAVAGVDELRALSRRCEDAAGERPLRAGAAYAEQRPTPPNAAKAPAT